MSTDVNPPRLDPSERHVRIPSPRTGLSLFLRHLPPTLPQTGEKRVVLYVHGGTFPSALSIAHRFDGRSWRDELADAGYHVWALDFHGFGRFSDPYPEFERPAEGMAPLGRAEEASQQLEAAVRHICAEQKVDRISLIAHSWGTMVSGLFAGRCPELVDRLVFFGPIARRDPTGERVQLPGWRPISLKDQWDRFTETVPAGEKPVLLKRHFDEWGELYLDVDPESRTRSPAAVKVPSGAFQDIFDAWVGEFAYDPALVKAPVAFIRGEWDRMSGEADARWLFEAFSSSPVRRNVTIGRGTHLMHLEASRYALYRETEAFLASRDTAPEAV
ncbi:MAG TPA: alpha/beta hydrolase [Aliidongia sp.]|uniref:alpha/beta hydrolase n=1 Tax=Aliidongia sp. TaxID=1914230 RepID=UPI002DDC97DF|nr:alpha/beta hydrolase [Aliidongia sp.]HEV2677807.1 alpha/beta hydrolase [Aliidongia sp.]